jgi:putative transposase
MKFESGHVYHVYNQGNNRQPIFHTHADYIEFLTLVKAYILPGCDVLAWCLLPNHFHFMIFANENSVQPHRQGNLIIEKLTNSFRKLLSGYAHQFNKRNNRSGSLFRPKTKAKDISVHKLDLASGKQDYYLNCFYYIHQNPLRHQLVKDLDQWKYSSFLFYAGKREKDCCNKQLAVEICEYDTATFLNLVYNRLPDEFLYFIEKDMELFE